MAGRKRDAGFDFGPGHAATYTHVRRRRRGPVVLLVLLVAVLGAGAALVHFQPQVVAGWIDGTPLADLPYAPRRQPMVFYKWRDGDGQWQMTDRPPPAGVAFETVRVNPGQNVLPLPPKLRPGD